MPFINPAQGAELNHLTPRPTQSLWGDNYLSFDSADRQSKIWLPSLMNS